MKRKLFYLSIILVLLASTLPSIIPAAADDGEAGYNLPDFEIPEKGNPKLDSRLNRLAEEGVPRGGAGQPQTLGIDIFDGNVRVIVECQPGQVDTVTRAAGDIAASIETSYRDMMQLIVPVSQLTALAETPGISKVRMPYRPATFPVYTAEGLPLINADDWQAAGYTGAGIKVAVLDLGFQGYEALLDSELPATVTTHSEFAGGDIYGPTPAPSVHGTACAEVVHDLAPDADLYLVNYGDLVEMGNAVDWLISQGIDIITHSRGSGFGGPGDGTGLQNDIVNAAHSAGILFATAMGNSAMTHWAGPFVDPDGNDFLNFAPGDPPDESNAISATAGGLPIVVGLRWDDAWGTSANDYDLCLMTPNETEIWSIEPQDGMPGCIPLEIIQYQPTETGTYHIFIYNYDAGPVNFHLHTYYHPLQYQTPEGSFAIPSDSPNAMAVGAVHWNDPTNIEPFSSWGPTDDDRIIPNVVAPDAVSTASYGPSNGLPYYDPDGGFYGTSCSTPYTAGAAALVMEAYPGFTNDQVKGYLMGNAVDLGPGGPDNTFGSGRINLGDVPAPPGGSISGYVYDAAGPAIEGATVSAYAHDPAQTFPLMWQPDGTATTNPDGSYSITGLPAGPYKVAAVASGHERRWWQDTHFMVQATPLALAPGQAIDGIDFSLGPGGHHIRHGNRPEYYFGP